MSVNPEIPELYVNPELMESQIQEIDVFYDAREYFAEHEVTETEMIEMHTQGTGFNVGAFLENLYQQTQTQNTPPIPHHPLAETQRMDYGMYDSARGS